MKKTIYYILFICLFIWSSVITLNAGNTRIAGEDCTHFNPKNIKVKFVKKRWKIVDGSHWIMDFGSKKKEAHQALGIIKQNGFDQVCFVGRPHPSMTYFKFKPKRTTKIFIVRHAEKASEAADAPLTADGEKRAKTLAKILDKSGITVVYTTNTTRTKETVNNYADAKNISLQYYGSNSQLANLIKTQYAGKRILVAGHSGQVTDLMGLLGVPNPPQVYNGFNNLFIVTIPSFGAASLTHLKYEIHHNMYRFKRMIPMRKR
jgi:phosphohistidine phosphatase SixA